MYIFAAKWPLTLIAGQGSGSVADVGLRTHNDNFDSYNGFLGGIGGSGFFEETLLKNDALKSILSPLIFLGGVIP